MELHQSQSVCLSCVTRQPLRVAAKPESEDQLAQIDEYQEKLWEQHVQRDSLLPFSQCVKGPETKVGGSAQA